LEKIGNIGSVGRKVGHHLIAPRLRNPKAAYTPPTLWLATQAASAHLTTAYLALLLYTITVFWP